MPGIAVRSFMPRHGFGEALNLQRRRELPIAFKAASVTP